MKQKIIFCCLLIFGMSIFSPAPRACDPQACGKNMQKQQARIFSTKQKQAKLAKRPGTGLAPIGFSLFSI